MAKLIGSNEEEVFLTDKIFTCLTCMADFEGKPNFDLHGEPCCDECFEESVK